MAEQRLVMLGSVRIPPFGNLEINLLLLIFRFIIKIITLNAYLFLFIFIEYISFLELNKTLFPLSF